MENQEKWIDEILFEVDSVPVVGTPGTIVVYGKQAAPILSTKNPSDVLIAAAELGKGRVVVFSHDNYFNQFNTKDDPKYEKLNGNIQSWLCCGKDGNVTVASLENKSSVPETSGLTILLWRGADKKSDQFYEDLLTFVRNGGGLLLAMTPWGYLQIKGGTLTDMPMYNILREIGICYTSGYFGGSNPLPVKDNGATNAHLARLLQKDFASLDHTSCNVITQAFCHLPSYAMKEFSSVLDQYTNNYISACCPSEISPCKEANKAKLAMYLALQKMNEKCKKVPGIESFPGECNPNSSLETVTLEFISNKDRFHSTGYYLPAGVEMAVTALSADDPASWEVRIGAHSDDISKHEQWKRWPNICKTGPLNQSPTMISSQFGGLVYVAGPRNEKKLNVRLENVVKAPHYILYHPNSVEEWPTRRCSPAPWADLVGKNIILTLPSNVIRDIDPKEALKFWDEVVQAHYDLRGVDFGRQWFVPDVQPSAGYMHAGYPIVTHMDVTEIKNDTSVLNVKALRQTGSWGHFHEVGHNLQSDCWTFDGTSEVTCNIFTLHAMDIVCGIKPWIHKWLQGPLKSAQKYLNGKNDFSFWKKEAGVALFIYAQLARDFGWNAYKKVFREYERLPNVDKPKSFQQKIDQWIIRFSTATDRNLIPLFELWRFPISEECDSSVKHLKPYLPDDELTRSADERVSDIVKKYADIDRCGNII